MQIQLTKTKTITIGGGVRKRKPTEVVGVDLFSGDARGVPAVRLDEKKGVIRVVAAGFVPPPPAELPGSWDEAAKSCAWTLPPPFQAPRAALAVTSPDMFLAQTTLEAFKSDFAAGSHKADDASAAKPRRFGIKREQKPVAATPSPATEASSAALADLQPGDPISNGGTRFVMKPMSATGGFVMEAGIPEYQLLWLSRLLPEGKRPTAASIQLRPAALAASVIRQPDFLSADGAALALFVGDGEINIAGFKDHDLVLWRACRGVPGWQAIRNGVKKGLGLEDEMVEGVLDDTLIDPRPVLEPLITPIVDELAVSRAYLVDKLGAEPKTALVLGLPAGARYWSAIAEDRARIKLTAPGTFDGLARHDKAFIGEGCTLDGTGAQAFAGALGAALALAGEEASE